MAEDPVKTLIALSKGLIRPIIQVIKSADADTFKTEFDKIKPKIEEWDGAFRAVPTESIAASDAAASTGELMKQLFTALAARRDELGLSARDYPVAAAAAGGKRKWKMPRKMSRKYCKKTPCRKMGFTQRSSCRPYKNCFTRRARKST